MLQKIFCFSLSFIDDIKYQTIELDMKKTFDLIMEENKELEKDFTSKIDKSISLLEENYANDHMALVSDVEDCTDYVETIRDNQENVTHTLEILEDKVTKVKAENDELEKIIANLDLTSRVPHDWSEEKDHNIKMKGLESQLETLSEKVNHFVQKVMAMKSLPQKVMIMQRKLATLEKKLET